MHGVSLPWSPCRPGIGRSSAATSSHQGSALGGAASIFYVLEFNLDPNMGVMIAVKGLTAAIIGGPGSIVGAILGAFLLSGVEQASVWYLGSTWRNAMAFVLLFVFLLVKPTGLFGRGRDF